MLQAGFNATIELTDDDGDDDDDDDEREASAILPIVLGVSAAGVVIALTLVLTLCAVHRCRSRCARMRSVALDQCGNARTWPVPCSCFFFSRYNPTLIMSTACSVYSSVWQFLNVKIWFQMVQKAS